MIRIRFHYFGLLVNWQQQWKFHRPTWLSGGLISARKLTRKIIAAKEEKEWCFLLQQIHGLIDFKFLVMYITRTLC